MALETIYITVRRNNEMISLTMEDVLPPKSLWNASILAYGCETHTAATELSESLNKKLEHGSYPCPRS